MVSKVAGGFLKILGFSIVVGGFALLSSALWVENERIVPSTEVDILTLSAIVALFVGVAIVFAGAAVLNKNKKDQEALKPKKDQEARNFQQQQPALVK